MEYTARVCIVITSQTIYVLLLVKYMKKNYDNAFGGKVILNFNVLFEFNVAF